MDLYLIRHADAVPLGEGGNVEDADRPLTDQGHAQAQALAAVLQKQGVRLDQVVSSPLLRARQTAEALQQHWAKPMPELVLCDELIPGGKPRKLSRFLRGLDAKSVAAVGHMPDLAEYLAWLLGSKKAQLTIEKAGVAYVRCAEKPGKGGGLLEWLVTPAWCAT